MTRTTRLLALAFLPVAAAHGSRAQPAPPAWVADAVAYEIFPERFANGDPSNDPTWESLDFNDRIPRDAWRTTPWTADW